MSLERIIPAPQRNPEVEPFYKAAGEGRFLIRRCTRCSRFHWYPRSHCPFCRGTTEWVEGSGRGKIYSYSVMRRVNAPFVLAYVELAEGPRMMTNLVNCDFDALAIGQEVALVFKAADDGTMIPCFTPIESRRP